MAAKSSPACQGVGKAALDLFCAGSFWATHSKTNERPKKKYEIQDSDLSKQNVNLGPAWHLRFPCGHTRLPAEVCGTSLTNDEVSPLPRALPASGSGGTLFMPEDARDWTAWTLQNYLYVVNSA
jgi:hypothetical protein